MASLADLLVLLIQNEVPLAEAIELASQACGSSALARGGQQFAEQLRRGERMDKTPEGFSPLLAWTLAGGQSQSQLLRSLTRSAQVYRDEFNRRGQWLSIYVPLFLTIGLGGGVALVYAAVTLGPWVAIMQRLSQPF
jgi:type II secretory pathway component PulF